MMNMLPTEFQQLSLLHSTKTIDDEGESFKTYFDNNDEVSTTTLSESLIECEILTRVRFSCLQNCKCVSKAWLSLVTNPSFAKYHAKYSRDVLALVLVDLSGGVARTFDVKDLASSSSTSNNRRLSLVEAGKTEFAGSCNGLICFCVTFDDRFEYYLYNPATRIEVFLYLLLLDRDNISLVDSVYVNNQGHGFGYDSKADDYKCVTIFRNSIYVYSTKSRTSKRIGDYSCEYCLNDTVGGVSAKNSLHWLYGFDNMLFKGVFSVELDTGLLYESPFPRYIGGRPRLTVIGETLHVVCSTYVTSSLPRDTSLNYRIDLWAMKEYGVSSTSWVKLFCVELEDCPFPTVPILFLDGGRKVLLEQGWYEKTYVLYDLITRKREGKSLDDVQHNLDAIPCLETLIDPRQFGR